MNAVEKVKKRITFRSAYDEDLEQIFRIWQEGTADTFRDYAVPENLDIRFKELFAGRNDRFNFWVACRDEKVIGWTATFKSTSNPFKEHLLAEISTYLAKGHRSAGIGTKLMAYAFRELHRTELQAVFATIEVRNHRSINLFLRTGFRIIGTIEAPLKPPHYPAKLYLQYRLQEAKPTKTPNPGGF